METYSVLQISEMLKTNPETVRRWIREGKLEATKKSKKTGNVITEGALKDFLKNSPKYKGIVAGTIVGTGILGGLIAPGVTLAAAGTMYIADLLGEASKKNKASVLYDKDTFTELVKKKINTNKEAIDNKQDTIRQLQKEIRELKKNTESLTNMLNNLSKWENTGEKTG